MRLLYKTFLHFADKSVKVLREEYFRLSSEQKQLEKISKTFQYDVTDFSAFQVINDKTRYRVTTCTG
jgi:hypothetical protein